MEFGLYTFGDLAPHPVSGERPTAAKRLGEIVAAARLADEVGLNVFGVGEHHRLDFAASNPAVVLSAIAAQTNSIRLTSAATVLAASDPVRVFEDFATLDVISGGRAEIMAGRGAFVEAFSLFGYDLSHYDAQFLENYGLLRQLVSSERVTWRGRFRSPLEAAEIAPRPCQDELPVWIAVGGSEESAARAGALGAPMVLAALGGPIMSRRGLVQGYRAAAPKGTDRRRIALACHTHVGATSQSARDIFFPHYTSYWRSASRGRVAAMRRDQFDHASGPGMALMVGSPQEITERLLIAHETLGIDRFIAQIDVGSLPFSEVAAVIERLGTKVAPAVNAAIGTAKAAVTIGG